LELEYVTNNYQKMINGEYRLQVYNYYIVTQTKDYWRSQAVTYAIRVIIFGIWFKIVV